MPGVTGKFCLEVQNEAGQWLTEFCREIALVIANTLFQQYKRWLYSWTSPDGQYWNQIDSILCSWSWESSILSSQTRLGTDWLRSWTPYCQIQTYIEEVEKTSRPFRYDLDQIPYNYTVTNRFKGLDLIEYLKNYRQMFMTYAEYIMWNARLYEAQAGIKIARRNINNLRYADNSTLMAESEEELKSLLMKMKEKSEKAGLKLSIKKIKIMASGPITSWQIHGETMETVTDFIFLGSKIIADGDCSHEIKRCLLLGRKVITNVDSILKSRDITLLTKVHLVKVMVFPVVMYGCESWTVKKPEHRRIDAFELWCWRRLLRVPWTARRSSQATLKEISPEYSLEGLMLKLKL